MHSHQIESDLGRHKILSKYDSSGECQNPNTCNTVWAQAWAGSSFSQMEPGQVKILPTDGTGINSHLNTT